jgi:hypothetical protein
VKAVVAEKPPKRMPTIVLKDVTNNINETELLDQIVNNNNQIKEFLKFKGQDISEHMKIKFKFRKKDKKFNDMYCLQVSPDLRKIIFKSGRIFIGWNSCRIEDSLPIIRCFRCNDFGHKSTECQLKESRCGHCAGPHETKTCTTDSDRNHCTNCAKHNSIPNQKNKYETKHSAYDRTCKSFIRIQSIVKSRIDYE